MTGERGDRAGRKPGGRGRSELPVDPVYWSKLADRIESDALPELRAALEQARAPSTPARWISSERAAWLEWVGRLGRWAVPATALACALWLVVAPSQENARLHGAALTVSADRSSAEALAPDAWREAVVPEGSLGRLMAEPSVPSVGQLLPWTAPLSNAPSTEQPLQSLQPEASPETEEQP